MDSRLPPLQSLSSEQVLRLNHRAGEWLVRRKQPGWSEADEQALNAWLEQDPRHRQAMDGVSRTWREAEQLKAMFPAVYGRMQPEKAAPAEPSTSRPATGYGHASSVFSWWRRPAFGAVFAALLCSVVVGGYGWHRWDNTANYALDIATAPGELRSIDLPDGSHIELNVNSRLQVRYYPRRRETVLAKGEAFFKVAADAAQPFTVDGDGAQVRVVGTAFNVRTAPLELVVQVQEGRVEVRSKAHPEAPVQVLGPNTAVTIDATSGQSRSLPVMSETIAQWRTGQVYFRRTPLHQVAEELSRYLGQPVEIDGAALRTLPISGLMALTTPERFLMALPSVANVSVQRRAEGGWLIRKR